MSEIDYLLHPIGFLQSSLKRREDAPRQGREGAPDAWLTVNEDVAEGLDGIVAGDELIIVSWFHRSLRPLLSLFNLLISVCPVFCWHFLHHAPLYQRIRIAMRYYAYLDIVFFSVFFA